MGYGELVLSTFLLRPLDWPRFLLSAKDAPSKMQSFHAIKKVAISKGRVFKNDIPSLSTDKAVARPK